MLREPFPPGMIGKLPKPKSRDAVKGHCNECGGWHGLPAVHLDYVGHAAVTDRLLQVDPTWTWEPLALADGLPALDRAGNLWIRLTVNGVTRLGVGDGANAKECISDAIRNAAMRFGVALDLWAKEDLHAAKEEIGEKPAAKTSAGEPSANGGDPDHHGTGWKPATDAQKKKLNVLVGNLRDSGHITTEQLWRGMNLDPENGRGDDGELHWSPLRDLLNRDEAHALIERLAGLEERVGQPSFAEQAAAAIAARDAL
jgi:hypothetical protein